MSGLSADSAYPSSTHRQPSLSIFCRGWIDSWTCAKVVPSQSTSGADSIPINSLLSLGHFVRMQDWASLGIVTGPPTMRANTLAFTPFFLRFLRVQGRTSTGVVSNSSTSTAHAPPISSWDSISLFPSRRSLWIYFGAGLDVVALQSTSRTSTGEAILFS